MMMMGLDYVYSNCRLVSQSRCGVEGRVYVSRKEEKEPKTLALLVNRCFLLFLLNVISCSAPIHHIPIPRRGSLSFNVASLISLSEYY